MRTCLIVFGIMLVVGFGWLCARVLQAFFSDANLPALQIPLLLFYGCVMGFGVWLLRKQHFLHG